MINFQSRSLPQVPQIHTERPEGTAESMGFGGLFAMLSGQTTDVQTVGGIGGFTNGNSGGSSNHDFQSDPETAQEAMLGGLFAIPMQIATVNDQPTAMTQTVEINGLSVQTTDQKAVADALSGKGETPKGNGQIPANPEAIQADGQNLPTKAETPGEIFPTATNDVPEGDAKKTKSAPVTPQNPAPRQTGPAIQEPRGNGIETLPLNDVRPSENVKFQTPTPNAPTPDPQPTLNLTAANAQTIAPTPDSPQATEKPQHLNVTETTAASQASNAAQSHSQSASQVNETPAQAPIVDSSRVINQIVEPVRLVSFARVGQETITVHLNPPELGRVEVEVNTRDTHRHLVDVVIRAERPDTEKLLGQHLSELRDAIENRGMTLSGFQLGTRGNGQQHTGNGTAGTNLDLSTGETNTTPIVEANKTPTPRLNRSGHRSALNVVV